MAIRTLSSALANRLTILVAILLAAVWLGMTAGCQATPTPEATMVPLSTVRPLPSETSTPTATATLTPSVTPLPTPTITPVFAAQRGPEPGCQIRRTAEQWSLEPAPEAPPEVQSAWRGETTRTVRAEVLRHDADNRRYVLRPVEPPGEYDLLLSYSGDSLPLGIGSTYRFTAHQEVPAQPPAGSALRIEDEGGLVFLGVSVRETEGATGRLLGGDRAGIVVRQLPTECRYAVVDSCGYELRAAPVSFARGESSITLRAGESGLLGHDPAYLVTLYASHYRLWVRDAPCPDSRDWVLSYRIERAP